jgi:hypothetical protein
MSGMRSTRPWQVLHPIPRFTWDACAKYAKSGRSCTRFHSIDWSVRKLSRTGSSITLWFQICEWQFMQVLVDGMPALAETSTAVWQ